MGSSYSPTDLCALSLTTCIITTIAIYAEFKKIKVISIEGATTKKMANTPPRRIDSIDVTIHVKLPITSEDRVKTGIERAAHACPVSKSLHPEINQNVVVNFIQ